MSALNTSAQAVPTMESDDPLNLLARMSADTYTWTKNFKSPRIIKTHLPMAMLPPDILDMCKVVFVARYVKKTH